MNAPGTRSDVVIVTPEHVEIRLRPAGAGARFLALITDFAIVLGASSLIASAVTPVLPAGVTYAVSLTLMFFLTFAWHIYFDTRREGRTPGKALAGIRVVDARGLPISPAQSLVRNVARALDGAPALYAIGAIVATLDPQGRRIGDLLAGTLVVTDEQPPALEAGTDSYRASGALRRPGVMALIRHRIGLEEREFLVTLAARAAALSPEARYDIMEEVAAHYRTLLGIDDPHLSSENLVRELVSVISSERRGPLSPGAS